MKHLNSAAMCLVAAVLLSYLWWTQIREEHAVILKYLLPLVIVWAVFASIAFLALFLWEMAHKLLRKLKR
jgi:hypothetical protein